MFFQKRARKRTTADTKAASRDAQASHDKRNGELRLVTGHPTSAMNMQA